MPQPQIILLNGASSSGKTTLANELRNRLPQPAFYYSSDLLVEGGMLPEVDRERDHTPQSWKGIRPRFFHAFHHSIAGFAQAGIPLLVEHIVEYADWFRELVLVLQPFSLCYIGVHCPPEVIEQREAERGDRAIGEGRSHLEDGIHTWSSYDFSVDTRMCSPAENAARIIEFLAGFDYKQSVFQQKYKEFYEKDDL